MLHLKKCGLLVIVCLLPLLSFSQMQPVSLISYKNSDRPPMTESERKVAKVFEGTVYTNTLNPMLLHIGFDNFTGSPATVIIKDGKSVIYGKMFSRKQEHITLRLNTAQLANGVYTITIQNKKQKIVKTVDLRTVYTREEKRIAHLH